MKLPRLGPLVVCALVVSGCAHSQAPSVTASVAPTATVDADASRVRLRLTESTDVVLADVPWGIELLSTHDEFLAAMTPLDRRIRLGDRAPTDEAALVARIAAEVRPFTSDEVETLRRVVAMVSHEIEALGLVLPLPTTIEVVKTTGREEVDAPVDLAYTRGRTIILNSEAIRTNPEYFVRHELFHVLTRTAPSLRDELYAVIGYRPVSPLELPPDLESRRLTNPDSPNASHVIRVRADGSDIDVANVLVASRPYDGGSLFAYLVPLLVAVDDRNRVALDASGKPRVYALDEVDGYIEQIGRNTRYVMQPEEVLADNFALLLRGARGAPTPRVLQGMLTVLRAESRN